MRILMYFVAALAVALCVRWGVHVWLDTVEEGTNDFELFWLSARALIEGRDIYATEGFGYPYLPTFYLLLVPFGLMPLGVAIVVWHALKCVVLAFSVYAMWRLLRRIEVRPKVAAAAIVVALLGIGRALDSDMRLGQCNVFVLGLVMGSIWAYSTHRDEAAGGFAGLATLAKVTPGLLLLYFAWKRRWRVVGAFAVALLVLGLAAPVAVFGVAETKRLYSYFGNRLVLQSLEDGAPAGPDGYVPGQSLAPIAYRLLTDSQAVARDRLEREYSIHVADLDERTVNLIVKAAIAVLLVVLLAASRPVRHEDRRTLRALLEFGMVAAVMLLASPYARKAHFVHLLPLFAPLAVTAIEKRRPVTMGLVVLAALLPFLTSRGILGRDGSMLASAFGPFTAGTLALLVAAVIEVIAARREERQERRADLPADLELSVFFPARNEETNIGQVVEQSLAILPQVARRFEVIVVDDGSTDGTGRVVDWLAQEHPGLVRRVRHEMSLGYGAAVRSGLEAARFRHVFFSDGDGQFDLADLPRFLVPLSHRDAVIGYRRRRSDPWHRKVFAYAWGALVRTLFGIGSRDIDCAYKVLPTAAARSLALESDGALISTELLAKLDRSGCRWAERPVRHLPRRRGQSSGANPQVIARAFLELLRFRRKIARFAPVLDSGART